MFILDFKLSVIFFCTDNNVNIQKYKDKIIQCIILCIPLFQGIAGSISLFFNLQYIYKQLTSSQIVCYWYWFGIRMILRCICYIFIFTTVSTSFHHTNKFLSRPHSFIIRTPSYFFNKHSFALDLFEKSTEGSGKTNPKLDFNEDYYSVLEVSPTIPASDLKKAYYKMVFKYHPDNKVGEEVKALCNKQVIQTTASQCMQQRSCSKNMQ